MRNINSFYENQYYCSSVALLAKKVRYFRPRSSFWVVPRLSSFIVESCWPENRSRKWCSRNKKTLSRLTSAKRLIEKEYRILLNLVNLSRVGRSSIMLSIIRGKKSMPKCYCSTSSENSLVPADGLADLAEFYFPENSRAIYL